MDVTEIFKDAFKYSTGDWGKITILGLLIFGILILAFLTGISAIFGQFIAVAIFGAITAIFSIIIGLVYYGYGLSVIKDTIVNPNVSVEGQKRQLPEFEWSENIIDGFKVLILSIVYMIIPIIVAIVLYYLLGVSNASSLNQTLNLYNQTNGLQIPYMMSTVYMGALGFSMFIVHTVTVILSIIFSLFAIIAMGRLAETGKLGSIFEFGEISNTISKIGWGNYIIWFILLYIIVILISLVAALVIFIPIIGIIAYLLIVPAFLLVFRSRAIGLIYNESKK
ncbi:DUF4013 domain-containing protein [Methanobrevibacter sp. TMH8]|uniref:DUF4013 domain-containing protein n=1 Tax=Methanobrevibacter sp. TMH8 TaxID=2848611 RepID=UPI001CCD579A|nr:DUF4013 domain-containing protein [Methanobrevibacter sp. TMH8]MBZ9570283.1 DUF4013 domain-containing protein [Methanobrevibacter sp. TMH8]